MEDIKTPIGQAPIIPVLVMSTGAYLCWFGVHYWRSAVQWPTDPIKAILTGNPLPDNTKPADAERTKLLGDIQSGTKAYTSEGYAPILGKVTTGVTASGGGVGAATGSTLSTPEIRALWVANGGSPATAPIAAAIAQAESSGRVAVTSPNPDGGTNVGLWQLDTKGVGAGYSVQQLSDPNTNARVTVMHTSNGSNWNPWETYHTGAYKPYLT